MLYSRPIEMASASEQYRAGLLLAELLARTLGLGILVLDGLEILTQENRNVLNTRLLDWQAHFETVIFIISLDEKPEIRNIAWLRYFWVEGGTITALN